MITVFDVANYILQKLGKCTPMKLQKLTYYSQAWALAWDDEPLFDEDFQAWANGPVCAELFREHEGHFRLPSGFFDSKAKESLSNEQIETIDIVLKDYSPMRPHELSDLSHREYPWQQARRNIPAGMPCDNIIEKEIIRDYYAGVMPD